MRSSGRDDEEAGLLVVDVDNRPYEDDDDTALKDWSPRSDVSEEPASVEAMVSEVYVSIDRAMHDRKKTQTFKLFMFLYSGFLFPSLWSLGYELLNPAVVPPVVIPMSPSAVGLFMFVMTVLGLYGSLRYFVGRLGWKQKAKSAAQHKEDIMRIGRLSAALGVLGRVSNRVHAPDGLLFLFLVVYYTWFFTVIYEVTKNLNIVLTRDCIRNPYTLIISTVTVTCGLGVLALHCVFAAADRELVEFLAFFGMGWLFHTVLLLGPGKTHVHIHHWYWAFCAAHMCVFDSRTSQLAQAMLLACYIHGVALFGVEKCFYVSEDEDKAGAVYV